MEQHASREGGRPAPATAFVEMCWTRWYCGRKWLERTEPHVAELSTRRTPLDYVQINRVLPFDTIVQRLMDLATCSQNPIIPSSVTHIPPGLSLNPYPVSPKRLQARAPQSVPVNPRTLSLSPLLPHFIIFTNACTNSLASSRRVVRHAR